MKTKEREHEEVLTRSHDTGDAGTRPRVGESSGSSMAAGTKTPTSKAKTAYGLLSDVCRVITEEPRRYDQGVYLDRRPAVPNPTDDYRFPACGTIGCVAGWVAILTHPEPFDYDQTEDIAKSALGLDDQQAIDLFDGTAVDGDGGTATHASNGVKHIRAFQQQHAAQLRAKRVSV